MKFVPLVLTLSLLTAVLVVAGRLPSKTPSTFGPVALQASYELRCRGGGLKFNSTPGRNLPTGGQMMDVTVDFAAGTQAAGGRAENLKPGQCSWVDRGFRQGEPSQIRVEIVYFAQQQQKLHGSPVDYSPTAAERYPDAQNVPQYLSDSNHYWSFSVYNTNNGYLQATGQRSFKPFKVLPKDRVRIPSPSGQVR
ncbi:MAG: hypothetical protein ACJ741_09875 [Pyrinomonadaceae bacterium]